MEIAVDVVLPCLDEAEALPGVLAGLPTGWRAIVVDNGSTDGSAAVAERHGATVVHAAQRGYGAAVHAGLMATTAPIVAFSDADGSFDLAQLAAVVGPVRSGDADLVFARRVPARPGAWPPHARFANAALLWWVRRRMGVDVHDLGPMRAGRRTDLIGLDLRDRRSGYPLELLLRAQRAGWRIDEVPVPYLPRVGRSKVTGTVRGTVQAVRDMTTMLRRYA
ncbi:glycosyltransferase family 2 protein [Microbacterium esteraromaticum]|uniref:Glycosyltransferase family 2 protein n=1 Tax=Microbacterium esteraromaticum TaxID=57043 RepID=A0A939DTI6_9MICO|nr:glycosyltransferase family 2 protein [Microbacterium esteraromaticum]MBN8204896.1 glycosyltransferase family 2 protein [Microbacterium esteraromaticum]MBN8415050.1 glycosyltransferase family 2 protein [Microbacterium esteraromaticum]